MDKDTALTTKGTSKFYIVYFTDGNTGEDHWLSTWNDPNSEDESIKNGLNRLLKAITKWYNGTVNDIVIVEEE